MNRIRDCTTLALILLAFCGMPRIVAQEPSPTPTVLTIHPAGEPRPALRYSLVPEQRDLVPGNAAIFYHRACLMVATASRDNKEEEKASAWLSGPLGEMTVPRQEVQRYVDRFQNVLHEAELGAYRKDCDWEFDARKEGYNLLLPEIQEIRRVGRLVALKARLAVVDSKFDEAMHWLMVGFGMSRHVGRTPFLIAGLVGDAIAGQLRQPLEDVIERASGPNLYWALATRPRPLIEMKRSIDGERYILDRELPSLREVDGPAWSAEKARVFGDELFQKLQSYTGDMRWIAPSGVKVGTGTPRLEDLPSRMALAAIVARIYPEAKRSLVAKGRTASEIEAMPTLQVALIHTLQSYQEFRDDIFKWSTFPYWQSRNRTDQIWSRQRDVKNKTANPLLTMFTALMPATESALQANARVERQLDALQCVEAIRVHAANHDGRLPDSLDELTELPLPVDPMTGKPFSYEKINQATAILSAPYPPNAPKHPTFRIHYELKLVN